MKKPAFYFLAALIFLALIVFLYFKQRVNMEEKKINISKTIEVFSPAFSYGETIPPRYTCEGENVNPKLEIKGVPQEAKSLVLIVDDPDAPAGTWYHWIVYNIDPKVKEIKEAEVPEGAIEVKNSFGYSKYGGPCPPPGRPHRYYFKVYALKEKLPEGIEDRTELFEYIEKSALAYGELMGKFGR